MNEPEREIGDYKLGRTLGTGSTGKVKIGVHKPSNTQVAIKIIKKSDFMDNPDLPKKIYREIAIMRLLDHPHITKLIDVFESKNHLYIILEYAPHGELFDYLIQRKGLPREQAMLIFREIIYGIEFLHTHGICHRDIKLENIFLDQFYHVKIGDFGFARWLPSNIAETYCGSPHYAAPEVIRFVPYDGKCADIWSCGVILYALLAGRLPFDDASIRHLFAKIKLGKYEMPAFEPEVKDLISKMLCVDVSSRITISQIKSHPAFLKYLPNGYQVPRPLLTPNVTTPIEVNPSEVQFFQLLLSIGYNSNEEIMQELTANVHTNAKTFYLMYNRSNFLDSLPWCAGNDVASFNVSPEGALMMPPCTFFLGDSPDSPIGSVKTPQSFAQRVGWYGSALPSTSFSIGIEQKFTDIELPLELLMLFLQRQLTECGIKWFHQSDMELVAKRLETDMLLTITASYESASLITLCLFLVHGDNDEFLGLINTLQRELSELLNGSSGY
ncbi:CAMK family protein kinase [Histomonas meleagridis]|uniref:CAMK family protein kinase n=1 Tax=Histomonas meleagridis TaxID=135588 RepID=UPI00355938CE|nr:CAMK family protein kinase [Histomonas meleagridis]KAH0801305.1 CAMK family protein kinase [Histomonas meleagridis]